MPTGIGFGVSAVGGGELADYEKALHEVEATEESLLATLSFPDTPPKRGASCRSTEPCQRGSGSGSPR
jgi:hypothetical protein